MASLTVTRRDFLQAGAMGAAGLSLSNLVRRQATGAATAGRDEKSCIMIVNVGGPSQLDLFDPKPDAPAEIRGPFKAIRTASPEIQLTELLPLHAKVADKFSLVRTCCHTAPAVHDAGHQLMQTGRLSAGGMQMPHVGSVIQFLKGARNALPAHVVLPRPIGPTGGNMPHGQDGGFLGNEYDPFVLNGDPSRAMAGGLGARGPSARSDGTFATASSRRLTGQRARQAFDLGREPPRVRARYGMTRFGQSCLLARRLVEAGVRFVTVNTFTTVFDEATWDVHGHRPFTTITGMRDFVCPAYDQGYSALIEDLHARGRLGDTMVCNLAEFGRTPRINPAGGRDHWPQCWTVYFAGGGVQGGRVIGRSDENGAYPADRPVTPAEVVATIYHGLGVDVGTELPGLDGRQFPLVEPGCGPIRELF